MIRSASGNGGNEASLSLSSTCRRTQACRSGGSNPPVLTKRIQPLRPRSLGKDVPELVYGCRTL